MVRSLSRGRFDRSSPHDSSDAYGGGGVGAHMDAIPRSMKKQSYTPRGTATTSSQQLYSTPPRSPLSRPSPLDSGGRSTSRGSRYGRGGERGERGGEYSNNNDYPDDHRNPISEGRSYSHSTFSRSASTKRERFDDEESHQSLGGGSASHARDVLSKMRGGIGTSRIAGGGGLERGGMDRNRDNRAMYSEPKPPLRSLGRSMNAMSVSSPRRRLDLRHGDDDDDDEYENHNMNDANVVPASRYEVIGMKEELKKKESQVDDLRREMDEMQIKYEESMSSVRAKLVSTFKDDMQEMKTEWEEAFQRLKDESDTTQRAMEMELNEASHAKTEMEADLGELKAEYRTQMEEEKARSKERMEELKTSKEEDLERLRAMYEEHLDGTKTSAADVESELKEEIHVLLEENEKVKMCYENLETEMARYKSDLEELNSNYQNALNDNLRWEKEATSYKEELDDVCDENDKHVRHNKALENELGDTKGELERMTSQYQRSQAEKTRFEKEYNDAAKDRDETTKGYNELLKKLDDVQEERTLESRYTEALVKQRDNMNAIIENGQQEIDELKSMNVELSGVNKTYVGLGKEFQLPDSDASTLREELVKAKTYVSLGKEFHLPDSDASTLREELVKAGNMNERLETLGRERERYNATVKALKVDLKALHAGNVGNETSLQEHMRLLNEKWDSNESRLKQIEKLKSELDESIQLLEENAKERDQMNKDHHSRIDSLKQDLQETQTALVKMEREKIAMTDKLSDYEILDAKMKHIQEELESKCEKLQDRLAYTEDNRKERESQCKILDSDKRSLQAELDKFRSKKNELEDALDKVDDVKKGLKKKLESAYYDLEETQRELSSMRQDHEDEVQTFENELSKLSKQKDTIDSQDEEIKTLKEMLNRIRHEHVKDLEDTQNEVTESFKVQLRLMEEKHSDQDRRNNEYLEQKYKEEIDELRLKNKKIESNMKEQKENLDQKSMLEIKRRGEFSKQKQELEILRSKERHLETHVNQLEEHISKVVSDYEAKLQSSNQTVCSTNNEETRAFKKQVRELEKKLDVSSAAMKQIGKSSLLMEKENERLKHDKNELKLKLRKLVDCAEKFGPK